MKGMVSIKDVRRFFADYIASEGCSCCQDVEAHEGAEKKLAKLLKPEKYSDGSGFNWSKYKSGNEKKSL